MERYIFDENNGLWYELVGDYYLPMVTVQQMDAEKIGIWGERRRKFLREHMKPKESVHYSFADAGGISPNVVQPTARLIYMVRSDTVRNAKVLLNRVNNIAKGAALMTM